MAITPITANPPAENVDPWITARNTFDTQVKSTANAAAAAADAATTALPGKAPIIHTHDAADVVTGTFVVARIPDLGQSKITGLLDDLASKADLIDGLVPTSQLPPIAVTDFLGVVTSEAAMLALTGQRGDWALRSDVSSLAILTGEPSSSLANWQLIEIGAGAAGVTSVNGQNGIIVLGFSDVGAASAAQGALADTAVQPGDLATVATTGAYGDLSGLPTLGTAAAADTTDFATAAQGAAADTAVQPGDLGTAASRDVVTTISVPGIAELVVIPNGGTVPPGTPAMAIVIEAVA